MLANDRVMTIARSSPAGDSRTRSARAARGLSARHVTAMVGWPAAPIRSTTSTASEVEPEREMTITGWRLAGPRPSTPDGRRMSSDGGVATTTWPVTSRATAAATWAR